MKLDVVLIWELGACVWNSVQFLMESKEEVACNAVKNRHQQQMYAAVLKKVNF